MSDYPEHDKLEKIKDKTQAIGDFLEWASYEKDIVLCRETRDGYWPAGGFMDLLADWAGIDRTKLEAEKRRMLAGIRQSNGIED